MWNGLRFQISLKISEILKSGSRSLVVKYMVRYTVFLGTFKGFFVNLVTLKSHQVDNLGLRSFKPKVAFRDDFSSIKGPGTRGKVGPGPFGQNRPKWAIFGHFESPE